MILFPLRQCKLVELSRSNTIISRSGMQLFNEHLMRRIDEEYRINQFYKAEKMTDWLTVQGYGVNVKRVH